MMYPCPAHSPSPANFAYPRKFPMYGFMDGFMMQESDYPDLGNVYAWEISPAKC